MLSILFYVILCCFVDQFLFPSLAVHEVKGYPGPFPGNIISAVPKDLVHDVQQATGRLFEIVP